ncbi:MAG TPA: hypothetical protein VMW38_24830 [Terriglobia bacterium]|nr:hypothetical protein [Terriglobia bacterium]
MAVTGKKPHSRDLVSAVLLLKLSASEKLVLQALCWHYPNPCPSVARIAAMSSQSERWVRHCLRSLQKKGLIEVHYRRDGQTQDTNFYTVNPDRILMQASKRGKTTRAGGSEFLPRGNSVPAGGAEVSTPKQSALDKGTKQGKKKQKVIENKASKPTRQQEQESPIDEKYYPNEEAVSNPDVAEILSDSPSDLPEGEQIEDQPGHFDSCQRGLEVVNSQSNSPTDSQSPNSAAPSLPAARSENVAPRALTPQEAFEKALGMAPHPGEKDLIKAFEMWCSHCRDYIAQDVLQAFQYFLKAYPNLAASFGQPITNFWLTGRDGSLIKEMQRGKSGTVTSAVAADKSDRSDKPAQVEEPKPLNPPFDVDAKEWRHMGSERNWDMLRQFYHYPVLQAFDNFFKNSGIDHKEVARQTFVMKPELWPTPEDMRAEEVRLAELKALEASQRGTSK